MPGIFTNPTPLLSKVEEPYSLSERVNIATRSLHTQLNRLIIQRLPLALPPQTTNPSKYVSGLLYIAPIYFTFESLWQSILDNPCDEEDIKQSLQKIWDTKSPESGRSKLAALEAHPPPGSRIHRVLSDLQLPGLLRAGALRADIGALSDTPEHEVQRQLSAASQHGKLAEFLSHTRKSVEANPHVLLAYAWVLYMALFSGGRHIRAELREAGGTGPKFWNRTPSPVRPYFITQQHSRRREHDSKSPAADSKRPTRSKSLPHDTDTATSIAPGLQFFNFPGSEDGEDIKHQFKSRYAEAETHLTEIEKEDIVSEAQHIFSFMLSLISDLDLIMQTDLDLENEPLLDKPIPRALTETRDSIAVTHERLLKARTTDTIEKDKPKSSFGFIEGLVNQPIARLVQFGTGNIVSQPLGIGRRLSKDGPPLLRVSFSPDVNSSGPQHVQWSVIDRYVAMLVVVTSAFVAFLGWYYMYMSQPVL